MPSIAASLCRSFLHLLYPPLCLHCQASLEPSFHILCSYCMQQLEFIDSKTRCPYCFSCDFNPESEFCCALCRDQTQYLHRLAAVFDYEGPASTLVKQMKYGGKPYLAKGMGAFLAAQFYALNWPLPDSIIPMPMSSLRKFERGYNQSLLLAKEMAHILNRPVNDVLIRHSGDFSQAGLSYDQRKLLRKTAFSLKKGQKLHDHVILLIDDVATTGSSLRRSAEALFEGCPSQIYGLTVCRAI